MNFLVLAQEVGMPPGQLRIYLKNRVSELRAIRADVRISRDTKAERKDPWTEAELTILRTEASIVEIMARTGRTKGGIYNRRTLLIQAGESLPPLKRSTRPWTKEEEALLLENGRTDEELAEMLIRTKDAVQKRKRIVRERNLDTGSGL